MHTPFFILFIASTFSALFSGTFALREIIHIYFNINLMLLFNFLSELPKANICKKKPQTYHT